MDKESATNHKDGFTGTGLERRLDQTSRHERQQALRALLRTPLITADGPEAESFGLIRRHARWLKQWLGDNTGWRAEISSDCARLRKIPENTRDHTRPARDPKSLQSFNRRRYVLLCLVLASLERADRQTTLGRLADNVTSHGAMDEDLRRFGVAFEFKTRDERRDLVHVVRLLAHLGVVNQRDGDDQLYVDSRGDVLYQIHRPCLSAMIAAPRSPSLATAADFETRLVAITEQMLPESDDGRNRATRWSITRRLLDDPVVYKNDLTESERSYLETQRPHIVERLEEATGLIAEVRAEGLAMTDDRGDLTDVSVPEEGTDAHIVLLVAEFLTSVARQQPETRVTLEEIASCLARARDEFGRHWRREAREPGAEVGLARDVVTRLVALALARANGLGVVPLPAIGRYRLSESSVRSSDHEG